MQVSVLGVSGCPHVEAAARAARAAYPEAVVAQYSFPKGDWDAFLAAHRRVLGAHRGALPEDERAKAEGWATSPSVWIAWTGTAGAAPGVRFVGGAADAERLAGPV
jgi:hypothetical protein